MASFSASKAAVSAASMARWAFLEGGTFISLRRVRTAVISSMTFFISASAWGKARPSSYSGQGATIRASPWWGRLCQISSVTKGMKGCSRARVFVSTHTSTWRVFWAAASSPPVSGRLASSMYQSQKSSQIKSYSLDTAMPSSNLSRFSVTSFVTVLNRLTIHWSSKERVSGRAQGTLWPSIFMWMNRAAFQILLAKFRLAATFSSE